jgi:hypothetical protein
MTVGYTTKTAKLSSHEKILNERGYFLKLEFETAPSSTYLRERCVLCKDDGQMNMVRGSQPIIGEWNESLGKLLRRIGWIKPTAKKLAME